MHGDGIDELINDEVVENITSFVLHRGLPIVGEECINRGTEELSRVVPVEEFVYLVMTRMGCESDSDGREARVVDHGDCRPVG